jgi:hypothetical protein
MDIRIQWAHSNLNCPAMGRGFPNYQHSRSKVSGIFLLDRTDFGPHPVVYPVCILSQTRYLHLSKEIRRTPRTCMTFSYQSRGPPIVDFPQVITRYIRSDSPYLEAVSSIRNPRRRHAVATRTHLTVKNLKLGLHFISLIICSMKLFPFVETLRTSM